MQKMEGRKSDIIKIKNNTLLLSVFIHAKRWREGKVILLRSRTIHSYWVFLSMQKDEGKEKWYYQDQQQYTLIGCFYPCKKMKGRKSDIIKIKNNKLLLSVFIHAKRWREGKVMLSRSGTIHSYWVFLSMQKDGGKEKWYYQDQEQHTLIECFYPCKKMKGRKSDIIKIKNNKLLLSVFIHAKRWREGKVILSRSGTTHSYWVCLFMQKDGGKEKWYYQDQEQHTLIECFYPCKKMKGRKSDIIKIKNSTLLLSVFIHAKRWREGKVILSRSRTINSYWVFLSMQKDGGKEKWCYQDQEQYTLIECFYPCKKMEGRKSDIIKIKNNTLLLSVFIHAKRWREGKVILLRSRTINSYWVFLSMQKDEGKEKWYYQDQEQHTLIECVYSCKKMEGRKSDIIKTKNNTLLLSVFIHAKRWREGKVILSRSRTVHSYWVIFCQFPAKMLQNISKA